MIVTKSNIDTLVISIATLLIVSSCSLGSSIRDGEMAYDRKQYAVAVEMLTEEYDETNSKSIQARKAYLIGESYSYMGETDESAKWLANAVQKGYGAAAIKSLAYKYKKLGKYKAAIAKFEELKSMVTGRQLEIGREIGVCEQIRLWTPSETIKYNVHLLKSSSVDADYAPAIFEEDFLVFTSDREESTGKDVYNWTGGDHSDLYIVTKKGNSPRRFDSRLNSEHNEGAACFSTDYQEIYFTRCYEDTKDEDAFCKIMYSEQFADVWSEPVPLSFTMSGYNYGQPALIENDSVLIFSSNLPESIGKHDLYYSEKVATEDDSYYWSEPAPMPSTINTQGDELFAVGDGDTLYFSSDYLPGYGGLDIFKTYLTAEGRWSTPENLRAPINSSEDDYSFTIDRTVAHRGTIIETGYFTSSRKGYGYDDIYRYDKLLLEPKEDTLKSDTPIDKSKYIINLVIKTRTTEYENPEDPNSLKTGKLPLPNVTLTISDGPSRQSIETNEKGIAIIEVTEGIQYSISGQKVGYLNAQKKTKIDNIEYTKDNLSITINITLDLEKVFYNQEIVLDNIYYDLNKWNIRSDATPVLDSLSTLLHSNPQLNIELSSHTDCRGEEEYNMILSQKRAQSVVDYLISKNIRSRKLTPRGYGETLPIDNCECETCSDDQHQTNRRTSFKILK